MVDYTAYESISVSIEDDVATIEFHRPEKHNALSTEVMLDLQRAFNELELERDINAVIITGEGSDAFSAGADIEQYAGPSEEHDPRQKIRQDLFYEIYQQPFNLHAPVIAKISGYCVGGGLILAMYCDLRIADETSTFSIPTSKIGQTPIGGSTRRAVELVGEAKAKELVFTAGYIDAAEAHRIGLVNRVVPADDLDSETQSLVENIQVIGNRAVKRSKEAINFSSRTPDIEKAREREAEIWWDQFDTKERRSLTEAFLEE